MEHRLQISNLRYRIHLETTAFNPVRDLDLGLSLMRLASLDLSLAKSKSQINYSRLLVKQKKIQSIRLSLLLLFLNILLR